MRYIPKNDRPPQKKRVKTVPINYTLDQLKEISENGWYFTQLILLHQWHKFLYGADHAENEKIQFIRKFMKGKQP